MWRDSHSAGQNAEELELVPAKMVLLHGKTCLDISTELNVELPSDSVIPFLVEKECPKEEKMKTCPCTFVLVLPWHYSLQPHHGKSGPGLTRQWVGTYSYTILFKMNK